ncbi:hypothetical protein HC723_02730 [Vibrio sp. S11_S32]|uniref:hypothetical protein n=1 Tax=Vibrio sp. S11_S32 TaxID=2720225 RepID=UPI001680F288|nr:hypothetical protein [Vibrio sp. S11_S32]MBD1575370.1 hypothetical protein [Vibrio sp. S11_S32]
MNIKLIISMIPIMTILGCSSPQVIEPQPFSSENSYAYNIANQTVLTKEYKGKKSPLRDFSLEDKKDVKDAFDKQSNADSMLGLSLVTLLSGNPMLALGGAGTSGLMAISNSKHISSNQTWLIALNKNDFSNELEAQKFILNIISNSVTLELSKYGEVKLKSPFKDYPSLKVFMVNMNGEWVRTSIYIQDGSLKKSFLTEEKTNINGKLTDSYVFGFNGEITDIHTTLVSAPTPNILNHKDKSIKFDNIVSNITKDLPKGFYIYYPPFPKLRYEGENYINTLNPLPTIYTQGKKYEFLKPTP